MHIKLIDIKGDFHNLIRLLLIKSFYWLTYMKDTESNNIDDESVDQLSPIQQLAECPTAYNKTIINSYTQRNIV